MDCIVSIAGWADPVAASAQPAPSYFAANPFALTGNSAVEPITLNDPSSLVTNMNEHADSQVDEPRLKTDVSTRAVYGQRRRF